MSEYSKGDYTKCYEDICEIWYEDNLYCIVRTSDADKIIGVLNENEELKRSFTFKDNLIMDLKYSMNRLSDENEQLKSRINDYDVALKRLQDLADRKLKENEQLKKQNDFLTTQLAELSTYMMALGYDIELEFEDGRVIKLNEELKGDVE